MKLRPKNIRKFLAGGWYSLIPEFDPAKYLDEYDIERGLVAGDISGNKIRPAWKSNIAGYDLGRYTPTTHGAFGKGKEHYNYTLGVEKGDYYKKFTENLIDKNTGKFTDMGLKWALAVDALLPLGSKASFFKPGTTDLRESWTVGDNDAHNRGIRRNFTNLADYVNAIRNDQILGARHNIFLKNGKRYFYTDNEGNRHWVSPEEATKYNITENPVEYGWEGNTYWNDYELTGPKEGTTLETPAVEEETGGIRADRFNGKDFNFKRDILDPLQRQYPNILRNISLVNTLNANERIYNAKLKGIKPNLLSTYLTHRQVVGDEATKLAYYKRAALGQTKAARPFTSDADRQMAYLNEAKRIGDELRAQGDLADNQEIRRTSEESNLHQWDNTRRRTEVANANIAELNRVNAAKSDLAALKIAADYSSWKNYLDESLYKVRLDEAETNAILKQVNISKALEDIMLDDELNDLKAKYKKATEKKDSKSALEYLKQYRIRKGELERQMYLDMLNYRHNPYNIPLYAKSGVKITHKKKNDLLYKSAKDVVEHFRKMSKMSDDSTQRSYNNRQYFKLSPHPGSSSARRMQQGGVAPFVVYTPVTLGGETTTSSQVTSTKETSNKGKETLDLVKALFNKVEGLPVDVNGVYSSLSTFLLDALTFGDELNTNDIASIYLQSMLLLSNLKYSKEVYDKAKALATSNESLQEFAVTADGKYVVQNTETGKISEATLKEIQEKGLNPITNQLLLNLRAYSPELMFGKGDTVIDNVIGNGMGINKIGAQIKALAGSIGSSDLKLDGISLVESNRVKQGLQLLAGAPDGYYKTTTHTKDLEIQVLAALKYIRNMLSPSLRAILDIHGGTDNLIASFLASLSDTTYEVSILPLTGKATKEGNSKGGAESSAGLAFVLGLGPREIVEFNTGTSNAMRVLGIKGVLQTHSKENLGQGATLQDATKSLLGGYLLWSKATFGGSRLNSLAYSHIILNDSTIIGMDLPYTKDINGNEVPDFLMLKKMEQADLEIAENNIQDPNEINIIYLKYGLPAKFDLTGNLNKLLYKRFAAIQATLDESSLQNKDAVLSDEVALAGEIERDLYNLTMKKTDKNYELSEGMWFTGWGKDLLYKGTIFIPYSEDIAFAALSSGEPFKQNLPDNAATIQQMQYAPKASKYTAPDVTLSQIKNN